MSEDRHTGLSVYVVETFMEMLSFIHALQLKLFIDTQLGPIRSIGMDNTNVIDDPPFPLLLVGQANELESPLSNPARVSVIV